MELTAHERDSLTELINIGYGRAAGSLSELTGYRITLEVPKVSIHPIAAIGPMLDDIMRSPVACVNQRFSGALAGNALLLLDKPSAIILSRLLTDDRAASGQFDSNAQEIITEVGNILLNACLGVFGNLLHVQVNFFVPRLSLDQVSNVIANVANSAQERVSFGLMIHTHFQAKAEDVNGYLVIVLGIASLDRLLSELRNWEDRQLK